MKDLTGRTAFITGQLSDGLLPDAVGERVLRAIRDDGSSSSRTRNRGPGSKSGTRG